MLQSISHNLLQFKIDHYHSNHGLHGGGDVDISTDTKVIGTFKYCNTRWDVDVSSIILYRLAMDVCGW